MGGTFTHWMVVERALEEYAARPAASRHPLFARLLGNAAFATLGSIGPDYPYLSEIDAAVLRLKRHSWADRMHYENTGAFVACAVRNLAGLAPADFDACLAWLCGYATHLVADVVIHPVVNATVGIVGFNGDAHRRCELVQDAWIFHEVTGLEIQYAGYVDRLLHCGDPAAADGLRPALAELWSRTLRDNHPGASAWFDDIAPARWHQTFVRLVGQAADPAPVFRHVLGAVGVVYPRSTAIPADERARFVDQVRLPGGATGHFGRDVFDRVVARVVEVWERLLADVQENRPDRCAAYLRNWDLDLGVDTGAPYYWAA